MDLGSDVSDDSSWKSLNYNNKNSIHGFNLHADQRHDMARRGRESQSHVALHNMNGKKVGKGVVQPIEAGDSLEGLVLSHLKKPSS